MPDGDHASEDRKGSRERESTRGMSIVQRGNLRTLEATLRRQWRLGQSIVLCWSADDHGLLVIFVPHYYLGNFCAPVHGRDEQGQDEQAQDNETFIRELISGQRRKDSEELLQICERLDVSPTFIKLDSYLSDEPVVQRGVEQLIKRYGLSYVESRAVLLFDIVGFSLCTPFEQASQLNSLSYSLNSAYNKLLSQGIEINFARTTTGDGYYIWNRDLGPQANRDLFYFMLLVVADNKLAHAASRGNTVPVIRTAYHIGSHYELFQAEGVNPTVFSYIVGDVTIELARMLDKARDSQILIGDFTCEQTTGDEAEREAWQLNSAAFVAACNRDLSLLEGAQLGGSPISGMSCRLTTDGKRGDGFAPLTMPIVDKHGLTRTAYNLQIEIDRGEQGLSLGLDSTLLSAHDKRHPAAENTPAPELPIVDGSTEVRSTEDLIDDLARLLQERPPRIRTGD
jgi:hypothetical protein